MITAAEAKELSTRPIAPTWVDIFNNTINGVCEAIATQAQIRLRTAVYSRSKIPDQSMIPDIIHHFMKAGFKVNTTNTHLEFEW